jgi:O-antigen/teichoic acid export membrane protein
MKARIAKISLKSRFAKDVYIVGLGQIFGVLLLVLINKLVSIYLTIDLYAVFSIASRSSVVFGYIMLLSLGIALPRYLPIYKNNKSNESNFFLASVVVLVLSTFLVASLVIWRSEFIAKILFGNAASSKYIIGICLCAAGIAASTYIVSFFSGKKMFKSYAILYFITQVITLLAVMIFKSDIIGQLKARGFITLTLSFIMIVLIYVYNYSKVELNSKSLVINIRKILGYCVPRVPGEIVLFSYSLVPLIIISNRFGSEAAAAIAIAITSTSFVTPVFQIIGVTLLPHTSANARDGDYDKITNQVSKLAIVYLSIGLVSGVFVWFFSGALISIFFSSKYSDYSYILRIVYISVIPMSIYMLLRSPIDALTKKALNTVNLALSFAVLVILTLLLPSIILCAIAFPVSYLILCVLTTRSWQILVKGMRNR